MLEQFESLWSAARTIWDENENHHSFRSYVCADYETVAKTLVSLRGQANTFVEWGSGLGVVTIMASLLGFEAYGIEAESVLVDYSETLAEKWNAETTFATGSFIPDNFQFDPKTGDESIRTFIDVPAAYDELEMEICDFDLVYAYPWPTEHHLYQNVMREFGHDGSILLTYDAREGIELVRTSGL